MVVKSCLYCDKRHPLCHSTCEEYLEARSRYDEMRARRDEKRRKDLVLKDVRNQGRRGR